MSEPFPHEPEQHAPLTESGLQVPPSEPEPQAPLYAVEAMDFEQLSQLRRELKALDDEESSRWRAQRERAQRAEGTPEAGANPYPSRQIANVWRLRHEMADLVTRDRDKAKELAEAMANSDDPDDRAFIARTALALVITTPNSGDKYVANEMEEVCDLFADLMADRRIGDAAHLAYSDAVSSGRLSAEVGFAISVSIADLAANLRSDLDELKKAGRRP